MIYEFLPQRSFADQIRGHSQIKQRFFNCNLKYCASTPKLFDRIFVDLNGPKTMSSDLFSFSCRKLVASLKS